MCSTSEKATTLLPNGLCIRARGQADCGVRGAEAVPQQLAPLAGAMTMAAAVLITRVPVGVASTALPSLLRRRQPCKSWCWDRDYVVCACVFTGPGVGQ